MSVLPVPAALDALPDPAAVMVALVDQARTLLAQAKGIEGLAEAVEIKSRAEAIRVYTQQKDMGHEAELSAAEIVRRAERRIGQLIREGQANGEIAKRGDIGGSFRSPDDVRGRHLETPKGIVGADDVTPIYKLTDGVSEDEFEKAISEGRDAGNLSRSSVTKRVKANRGDVISKLEVAKLDKSKAAVLARRDAIRSLADSAHTSSQIAKKLGVTEETVRQYARECSITITADQVVGPSRRIDTTRVLDTFVMDLAASMNSTTSLMEDRYSDIDTSRVAEWVASLEDSRQSLNRIIKSLKETTRG